MELLNKRVEEFLHQRIPLSKAINCQVIDCNNKSITLYAPKFANTVEGDTLYGGSILSLGLMAAWALLHISLHRLDYEPLARLQRADWKTQPEYNELGTSITAKCSLPSDKEWQQFLRMLSRRAKSKLTLESRIVNDETILATLSCEYQTIDLDHK